MQWFIVLHICTIIEAQSLNIVTRYHKSFCVVDLPNGRAIMMMGSRRRSYPGGHRSYRLSRYVLYLQRSDITSGQYDRWADIR